MDDKVYIVDDDAAIRDSLGVLFGAHGFSANVFCDGEAFLCEDLTAITSPILLDVRMPGRDGLEILTAALDINPELQIIIMSGHGDIPMAVRALKKGAKSFIEKPFKSADIFREFSDLRQQAEAKKRETGQQAAALEKLSKLTPREREIMDHLVLGKPNKIIADDLGLSVRTVETHRARLLSKLDIRSLSDLVRLSLLQAAIGNN